jgi:hypothetical protein
MAAPSNRDPKGQPAEVPVVRVAPLVPWDDAPPLCYRVVEVGSETTTPGRERLVSPRRFEGPVPRAAGQDVHRDAWDGPYYRLAEAPGDGRVEAEERRLRAEHLELLRLAKLDQRRQRHRALRAETHWYQCLAYPLLGWPLIAGLATALSVASVWVLLAATVQFSDAASVVFGWLQLLIPLVVLVYGCAFLQCVLNTGVAGEPPHVYWPEGHLGIALGYAGRWLLCFLAGPVLPAGAALAYWLHCGELDPLDLLILAELGTLAVGYWLFAVLAVTRTGRLRDANPLQVAALCHRMGYRAVVATLLTALLSYVHVFFALSAAAEVHRSILGGWFWLNLCWFSGLSCAAFLLRMVGLWCHRIPPAHGERGASAPRGLAASVG